MTRFTAVRTDGDIECPGIDGGLDALGARLVLLPTGASDDDLIEAVSGADLLLSCYQRIPERVFAAAPRLRAVIKYGVGIDAIDIDAAARHDVPVANVPDYAAGTVAEAAFTLLLALAKRLPAIDREVRRSGWIHPTSEWLAADVAGKTVGIIGAGRIGRHLARMASAGFGTRVIAHDPFVSDGDLLAVGMEPADTVLDVLEQSDFVSLHATLNPGSRHLIGPGELACMKPTAYLINVSRGELVDEQALLTALRAGVIAGAGLDVFGAEPLARSGHPLSELFELDNVLLTPHLAFYTAEAMRRLEDETLQRCAEALAGRPLTVTSTDPRLRAQSRGVCLA